MSNLVCCVLTNVLLFPWQRAANTMLRSHFPRSATRAGGDYGTLSREKPHVKGSLPLLCRSSRSVSWPRGAFQGVWRLSSGPGGERQGCPKQKGADGGQVEVRLVQIDLMARMREIQQGRVGQGRLVLPGDCPFDIVTGSGQNQRRGVVRGKPRARIDVSMPVLGIGGGKDVVVEAIALHLPFGQVSRVTDGSLGDALDERIKERIRFPIRHQGMRCSRIDQSEQIPGDETRRIECVVILLLCCCRKPRGDQAFIRPLGFIDGGG